MSRVLLHRPGPQCAARAVVEVEVVNAADVTGIVELARHRQEGTGKRANNVCRVLATDHADQLLNNALHRLGRDGVVQLLRESRIGARADRVVAHRRPQR